MIGGCSKIVQDVPPFMIVDGNPGETRTINKIGMERHGVSEEAQNALRQAYKILFPRRTHDSQRAGEDRKGIAEAPGSPASAQLCPHQRARHQQVI